ncbi:hypothetical protein [Rubrivirga sp.]|uniref:hypothetical protein n=1 Tax=Rubrivirga sp. TaxID=1885344 RepID=UPI003C715F92
MSRSFLLGLALFACSVAASAQDSSAVIDEPVARGTAYFVFAEPGAPTVEVLFLGEGIQNGIYRLQRGTSLVEAIALAGGTPRSDSTSTAILSASIRVLRDVSGSPSVIFETSPERLIANRDRHPSLEDGDVIETEVVFEAVEPEDEPFTFSDGVNVASRLASVVSVVLLLLRSR